ncbi:hypothetical protein L0152_27420, partial [bacterium]|nr:hypothetical protein [bacterium]
WSPEYVSDRIHELHRRGFPLYSNYIFLKEKGLMTAAKRYFGSWDAALQKAGLNPTDIRLASRKISYQKEDIIRSLLERQEAGRPLNFASVYKDDLRLINASRRLFRSYSKALKAAGIDPDKARRTRRPYRAAERRRFLNAVRRIAAIPVSRRGSAIAALRKNYHQISLSLYGLAWKKIAREAGIPYHAIHPKAPADYSSRKKVITALKQRLKAGMEVGRDRVKDNKELFEAVLRYFPKYYDCYPAIGLKKYIPPVRRRYATREDVIAAIQKRDAMNLGIHLSDLTKRPAKKGDISLYRRAIQIFGAWSRALNAAGIPAEKQRPGKPPRYPTPESVLDEIRSRKRKGLSLVGRVVRRGETKHKDTMLFELAMRYFHSWPIAVQKALQIRK